MHLRVNRNMMSNLHLVTSFDQIQAREKPDYSTRGFGAYLFPKLIGVGKFELLGKYAKANFSKGTGIDYDQKTSEFNLNYIIKDFNARVMFFVKDTKFSAVKTNFLQAGVGLQIQM